MRPKPTTPDARGADPSSHLRLRDLGDFDLVTKLSEGEAQDVESHSDIGDGRGSEGS